MPAPIDAPGRGRHRYLDVLRGVALLGILPANMPFMGATALTEDQVGYWHPDARGAELLAVHLTRFVFDYKFITLFSVLFGVGISILRRRAEASGRPFGRTMARRLGFLWLFGIAHATLLWYGDIVSYYAPLGLLVCWTSRWPTRRLAVVGAGLVLVPVVGLLIAIPVAAGDPDLAARIEALEPPPAAPDEGVGRPDGSIAEFLAAVSHPTPAFERAVFAEGTWGRITILRALFWFFAAVELGWYISWRIAGCFLIGMALGKSGWFLEPAANRPAFVRLVAVGAVLGLPLQVAASLAFGTDAVASQLAAELFQYAGSLGLAAAYAGLVGLAVAGGVRPSLVGFEAIGRTAFSNYILQSVLATTLFYSYGFGLFCRFDRLELLGVVVAVWVVQLVVSPLWLRAFAFGPIEWLWRCLTYWRLQPWRAERL